MHARDFDHEGQQYVAGKSTGDGEGHLAAESAGSRHKLYLQARYRFVVLHNQNQAFSQQHCWKWCVKHRVYSCTRL